MACPHLTYRAEADETSFDHERAYCAVAETFVQPMRADVCNERYDLTPPGDCEIYRDHEGLAWDADPATLDGSDAATESADSPTDAADRSETDR